MSKLSQHAQSSFFSFFFPNCTTTPHRGAVVYATSALHDIFPHRACLRTRSSRPPPLRLSLRHHPFTILHLHPTTGINLYSLVQSGARRSAYSVSFTGPCQQLAQPLRRVASSANANAMHMHDTHSVTPLVTRLDRPKLGYAGYKHEPPPQKDEPCITDLSGATQKRKQPLVAEKTHA